MKIKMFTDSLFEENAYLVINEEDATLIDPGFNYKSVKEYLDKENLSLSRILLTHGHIDHIGDLDKFHNDDKEIKIYIHEGDYEMIFDQFRNCSYDFSMPKQFDKNLKVIKVKSDDIVDGYRFIWAPGHSKGSCLIKVEFSKEDIVFSGDTLFKGTVGRCDLYGGSESTLMKTLSYIQKSFSNKTTFYPGHYSKTTLKDEMENNPYMRRR